jgi:hypothetical protein
LESYPDPQILAPNVGFAAGNTRQQLKSIVGLLPHRRQVPQSFSGQALAKACPIDGIASFIISSNVCRLTETRSIETDTVRNGLD